MTRKKKTKETETIAVFPDASPAPSPEGRALLDALRSNLSLLGELAVRYEVSAKPEAPEDPPSINCPADVHDLLGPEMSALAQEQLRVLLVNIKNQVVGQRVIYQGNVNSTAVRAAEVLRPAVLEAVPSIVISHNHPSNDPTPSPEDVAVTKSLMKAAKLLGIELLDHVVIGGRRFVSLKERGLMG